MDKTTLYIGLFDKDSKVQKFTTLEAYKIAESIVMRYVGGATISEAMGIYKHDDGTTVIEPSLRVEIVGDDLAFQIEAIVSSLKTTLNQESVMVENQKININFI